jgi:hypothetical protein
MRRLTINSKYRGRCRRERPRLLDVLDNAVWRIHFNHGSLHEKQKMTETNIVKKSLIYLLVFLQLSLARPIYPQSTDAGALPVPTIRTLPREQCREYLPSREAKQCRIDFDMTQTSDIRIAPQTHKDITIYLGRWSRGIVVLWRSSPFAACSLTTTPGPLARDLSANGTSALTSAAGLRGFPFAGPQPALAPETPEPAMTLEEEVPLTELPAEQAAQIRNTMQARQQQQLEALSRNKAVSKADRDRASQAAEKDSQDAIARAQANNRALLFSKIDDQEKEIRKLLAALQKSGAVYGNMRSAFENVNTIRRLAKYSYPDNQTARSSISAIEGAAAQVVGSPLPDGKTVASLTSQRDALSDKVDALEQAYPTVKAVQEFVRTARAKIAETDDLIKNQSTADAIALVLYLVDAQASTQKILDFLKAWDAKDNDLTEAADASVQILPIALYPESKVAVTVKCTDAVTNNALFDSIQFNAYFQSPPQFDISSGVIISLLPGRQAALQTTYNAPSSATSCPANPTANPPTTSNCPTVIINRTRPQFMPGVFGEWHPLNFKLFRVKDPAYVVSTRPPGQVPTWMSDDAPRHPLGYVGSLGLAGGFMVNPNNGTVQAEFFEGLSFGIQRFVFLVGNHNGRSQNLTNGYSEGAQVQPGTVPATVSNWSNRLAFGITYRIPLR